MTKIKATTTASRIENLFSTLGPEEKASIISHGVALCLSELRKRRFLAESKVQQFEEKYHTTLRDLDAEGLADDADYELHEDYVMWHHWTQVMEETKERITSLEEIAEEGLYAEDRASAGR
ncbi:MAG: hypothetical protein U9R48_04225 [Chloroflexota bacterium]|nr:hypothetical protein [Chloroflexota bacterium]